MKGSVRSSGSTVWSPDPPRLSAMATVTSPWKRMVLKSFPGFSDTSSLNMARKYMRSSPPYVAPPSISSICSSYIPFLSLSTCLILLHQYASECLRRHLSSMYPSISRPSE